jgi:DMSO/TMAO reductase YedYZ molybdopterin-dependent catalytic subunit
VAHLNERWQSVTWKKLAYLTVLILALGVLVACAAAVTGADQAPAQPAATALPTSEAEPTPAATPTRVVELEACDLEPIAVPTLPAVIPGYTELDPATGLNVTGDVQVIDLESYRLEVVGLVDTPLSLSYDQLRCLPKVEAGPELVCPGFFVNNASWGGVPIMDVLALAGVQEKATTLRLVSADDYFAYVTLADLEEKGGFLAYEWEREPLPVLHGFPVRAVLPDQVGGKWVKWLVRIDVLAERPSQGDAPLGM